MNPGVYRAAWTMVRPYRRGLALATLLGLLATALSLSEPLAIGNVVRHIQEDRSITAPLLLLIGLFAADGLITGLQVWVTARVGTGLVLDLRRSLVARLLRAPLAELHSRQRGDLFSRLVGDTSLIRQSLAQSLATLTVSALTVVGSVILMTIIDVVLTLVTFGCLAVAAVVALLIAWRLRLAAHRTSERVGAFGAALQRALGAIRTIKISRAEAREGARIDGFATEAYHAAMRGNRLTALMTPATNLGIQAAFAAVFTVGAARLAAGQLDTARFATFLIYLFYLVAPLVNFFVAVAQLQQGLASVARLQAMFDIPTEDELPGPAIPAAGRATADDPGAALRLDGVHFGYQPGKPVLRDVSFTVPARGLVAIVGPSGAGKSTIFSLIERLWDVDAGRITLGGRDLRALPRDELRARIGFVEQDCPVLDGTIGENLRYANPAATAEQVTQAIRLAQLEDWIDGLERGLDTPVGEGGAAISGGERQRIAIARMLLLEPEVLLLDEATSQLDAASEAAVRGALRLVARRCAVVAIAHRMSTVVEADLILMVEDGRVRAAGSHQELMSADDAYRRLVRTQLAPDPAGDLAVLASSAPM